MTLGAAESCTGGSLTGLLTALPNASDIVLGAVVAYSAEAKIEVLGVPEELIRSQGMICEEAAVAMAHGVCRVLGTGVGVAITGNVDSESEGKPAGLVYVAACGPAGTHTKSFCNDGGQEGGGAEAIRHAVAD